MRLSLCQLFAAMNEDSAYNANEQGELFAEPGSRERSPITPDTADATIIAAMYAPAGRDLVVLPPVARRLFELSVDAFDAIIRAWISELPITDSIIRYGKKILAAAGMADDMANGTTADTAALTRRAEIETAQRQAADAAATDRGDSDVRTVLEAAYKVWHEIHRLMGLLRFCPNEDGVYIARCEPDHFVLPAFGPHFQERFGETPWAIIDEKRRLCLYCTTSEQPKLFSISGNGAPSPHNTEGEWENLWRNYHKTINNESRYNPGLQRQFMPRRYWKYLTELQE